MLREHRPSTENRTPTPVPSIQTPVPELCQNPISLLRLGLLFEREEVPQTIDIRHFRMELIESFGAVNILRN